MTAVFLSRGTVVNALAMVTLGLILSYVGLDLVTGQARFTFGIANLLDGVDIVPLAMGLFGISEVLINLEVNLKRQVFETKLKNLLPTLKDWADSIGAILRGSMIGFFLGALPGGGVAISSFLSYAVEKKISAHPEKFGTGAIEGVAGPETTGGSFVPLFGLGIPTNVVAALLLAALTIHGLQPGPLLLKQHPDLFWGTVTSMYVGNIMLVVLNLPLIAVWVQILKIPYRILFPLIILFCVIGAYGVHNSLFDVGIMVFFGIVGYLMKKFEYDGAPLILAFVLGRIMERAFRQSLVLSDGSLLIFIIRPISAIALLITLVLLLGGFIPVLRRKKIAEIIEESDS
jgi:putative tricarboxylic transport membrane protein